MAQFADLIREIALDVPGCPDFLIEKEIRNAAIQFCEESEVYTYQVTGTTVADNDSYSMTFPADTRLVSILSATVDDRPVKGITELSQFHNPHVGTGRPEQFYEVGGDIVFVPTPSTDVTYTILVSLKPTRAATSLDDAIAEDWYKAIVNLALHSLTMMPERTWTSPVQSQAAYMVYQQELNKAKSRRAGRQRVVRKTKFKW